MSLPVWLITASSSGFGKAIALEALKRGHKVIATARDQSKISSLQSSGAITYDLDVTWDLPRLQTAVSGIVADVGHVDILVNTAGYILEGALEETTPEETLASFETNVLGMINVTRAILPHMRARKAGVIANFGSLGSWRGGAAYSNYAAAKWSCSAISESLFEELKPLGITCTVIEPGYFRTGFLNAGSRVQSAKRIEDYDNTSVGQIRAMLDQADNNQPGDVAKGARVIVDVVTRSGRAEGREIPMRLPLGGDCVAVIREKCESTLALVKDWEAIITETDHDT